MWAASCLASCCASCTCGLCTSVASGVSRRSARLAYCGLFALSLIVSWILREVAAPLLEKLPCTFSVYKKMSIKGCGGYTKLSPTVLITFKEKMNSETALSAARRECNRLRRQNDYLRECCRLQNEEIERLQRELHKNEEALAERDEVYCCIRELNRLLRSDDNNPAAVFSRLN